MQYKFYVNEVPDPYNIWEWIRKNTNINNYIENMKSNVNINDIISLDNTFDLDKLSEAVMEAYNKYGYKGWRNSLGESDNYGGLSLTYNPTYAEQCDINQHTLGTEKNFLNEYFYAQIKNFSSVRNTYFDSYGFRKFAPCVTETKLYNILKEFKRSSVRSRIGVIKAENVTDSMREKLGWHKDETVFENLRINVPIKTDETFMFELEGKEPIHLGVGNMYTWDTHKPHRVFPTVQEQRERIHIVFGFSPWFDYDEEEDAFISNEYYGEMHPLDMLVNGHVHDKINGIK